MFKRFLKAKNGKELVEIILLAPITIFLIFYSIIQIMTLVFSSQTQTASNEFTRVFITERNFYTALTSLASTIDECENMTILSITITDKNNSGSQTISFSEDSSETTYFKNMYSKATGEIVFNTNVSQTFKQKYDLMFSLYERGNYVEIVTSKSISKFISSISKISIYNSKTKQRETLNYGSTGYVLVKSKNIIIG